jgi:hypothetical protein
MDYILLIKRLRVINEIAKIFLLSISRNTLKFEWRNLNISDLSFKACSSIVVACSATRGLMATLFK